MLAARRLLHIAVFVIGVTVQLATSLKQQSKETSMGGVLDFSKLIGDVVPSTYPVIKLNQNVSNDSTFAELRKRELRQLEEEILKLMPIQRHNFERIRDKLEHQTNQVDELAVAMERQ